VGFPGAYPVGGGSATIPFAMEQPFTVSVGIVGHRPDRLGSADLPLLSNTMRSLLLAVRNDLPNGARPQAVSSLAEGADRLFAEQAIDLGFHLLCPMPFAQSEYERDFTGRTALEPDSLDRFRLLLRRAQAGSGLTRLELPGTRADPGAYRTAGRAVLDHSPSLVVFVWDGRRAGKPEGTEEALDEACDRRMHIVWIHAEAPHSLHQWTGTWTSLHPSDVANAVPRFLRR
jgi:hypothetical protein